jgi:hypothetical protein
MKSHVLNDSFIFRQTEAEESDQTVQCVINTSLDTSSILGETEVGETKKKKMDKPSTVLKINPATDEDAGLDQATSNLANMKKRGKEDTVDIIVNEGKVLFIPKMENIKLL